MITPESPKIYHIVHVDRLNSIVASNGLWSDREIVKYSATGTTIGRWAFTLSNAGSRYFEDRCDLQNLSEIDWNAIQARNWVSVKEAKQAEFLIEESLHWG